MKLWKCRDNHAWRKIGFLIFLLIIVLILSFCMGRYPIHPQTLPGLIGSFIRGTGDRNDPVWILAGARVVRIAVAFLTGAGLSAAGAAFQGIFRNPMVSPDILGAATGASFGSALAILLGTGIVVIQISAFGFGLIAVAIACGVSSAMAGRGNSATMTLVLTGMVVSALFSALISIIKYIGDPYDTLPTITYIQMGGLTYVTAEDLWFMLGPLLTGMVTLILLRWRLNILSFEEEEASSLGVNPARLRIVVILAATLVSSSAVAVGGMIGWVGLIVPHIARMVAGPDYSKMMPGAILTGGIFLLVMDDVARCISAQEIPLGVLTAVVGAPFFLYLMFRGRKSFL